MTTELLESTYHSRLRRVLVYVDTHLEDDLHVERLSDVAALSKFHFHRTFTAHFGISVHRYVKLVRLKRAAYRLAFRDDHTVTAIAFDSGFESPEAFARAFKQRVGQTPSEFRDDPDWPRWSSVYEPVEETRRTYMRGRCNVEIVQTPDVRVAVLEHRGDPAAIASSLRTFIAWRRAAGLPPKVSATFNVMYDDPTSTPPEHYRLDLCAATDRDVAPNHEGILTKVIPGGRCAVFRHVGSDDGFASALTELYGAWLPQSGEELRDFPLYCRRVTFFPDVSEHEAVTDFFLPLN